MNKIDLINQVVKLYFDHNRSQVEVPAKDLMPYFIKAGTFVKDEKNGLPIRKVLRDLDKKNQLHLIPFVYADRKKINTNWYFRRTSGVELATKLVKAASPKNTPQNPWQKLRIATRLMYWIYVMRFYN